MAEQPVSGDTTADAGLPDELPPGTLEAAAWAIHRFGNPGDPCGCSVEGEHEGTFAADLDNASEAVWAAYPHIAAGAAERERARIAGMLADRADNLHAVYQDDEPDPVVRELRRIAGLLGGDGDQS